MILMFLYNTRKATIVSNSSTRHCSFLYKLCLRHIHIVRSFIEILVHALKLFHSIMDITHQVQGQALRRQISNSHLQDKLGQLHEPTPNPNTISLNAETLPILHSKDFKTKELTSYSRGTVHLVQFEFYLSKRAKVKIFFDVHTI